MHSAAGHYSLCLRIAGARGWSPDAVCARLLRFTLSHTLSSDAAVCARASQACADDLWTQYPHAAHARYALHSATGQGCCTVCAARLLHLALAALPGCCSLCPRNAGARRWSPDAARTRSLRLALCRTPPPLHRTLQSVTSHRRGATVSRRCARTLATPRTFSCHPTKIRCHH